MDFTKFTESHCPKEFLRWQWEKIKSLVQPAKNGCWEWQGSFNAAGVTFLDKDENRIRLDRYFAALHLQDMGSRHIRRTCGNSKCLRPDHFEFLAESGGLQKLDYEKHESRIISLAKDGVPLREIAKKVKMSHESVRSFLVKKNFELPGRGRRKKASV